MRDGSSSSATLLSGFSGSLDSSTCSSTLSCLVRRAISCDFNPLELRERQSSSLRRSFTYKGGKNRDVGNVHLTSGMQAYRLKANSNKFTPCLFCCWGILLEPYLHWFRVEFSPVCGSTKVLRFIVVLLLFLLYRKSLRQRQAERKTEEGQQTVRTPLEVWVNFKVDPCKKQGHICLS